MQRLDARLGSLAFHFSSLWRLLDVRQPKNGIDEMADAFPLRRRAKKPSSVAAALVFVSVVTARCSGSNTNVKHLAA